uniref:Uncharacterized protein n=1 Tax=Aegilops tauschii subsp. strangulata TaxID=200361 RepID=A0A452XZE5_AEGTS
MIWFSVFVMMHIDHGLTLRMPRHEKYRSLLVQIKHDYNCWRCQSVTWLQERMTKIHENKVADNGPTLNNPS